MENQIIPVPSSQTKTTRIRPILDLNSPLKSTTQIKRNLNRIKQMDVQMESFTILEIRLNIYISNIRRKIRF